MADVATSDDAAQAAADCAWAPASAVEVQCIVFDAAGGFFRALVQQHGSNDLGFVTFFFFFYVSTSTSLQHLPHRLVHGPGGPPLASSSSSL